MLPTIRRRPNPMLFENNDFDRLFNWALGGAPSMTEWAPAVDVRENEEDFLVTAELPGIKPADVEVSVENGVLSIIGEKREEHEEGKETGRHLIERRYGRFERSFSLPRSVNADKVEASFADGLLKVRLPKAAAAKSRKIKIAT